MLSLGGYAQDSIIDSDDVYGLDPVLLNGKLYNYYPPPGTGGSQYFSGSFYPTGSVWIRGVEYDSMRLNYDVYHQQLILFYKKPDGSNKTISVSDAWVDAFTLGSTRFIFKMTADSGKRIYQELGAGPQKLLYAWSKNWVMDPSVGAYVYIFTPAVKTQYLFSDNKMLLFATNRSFIKLFSTAAQPVVRKYIRQNRIRVKKASDAKMSQLMEYINKLNLR